MASTLIEYKYIDNEQKYEIDTWVSFHKWSAQRPYLTLSHHLLLSFAHVYSYPKYTGSTHTYSIITIWYLICFEGPR